MWVLSLLPLFRSFAGLIFVSSPSLLWPLSGPNSQHLLSYLPGVAGGVGLSLPLLPITPTAQMQEAGLTLLPGGHPLPPHQSF